MTGFRMHHPKSDKESLYIQGMEIWRDLIHPDKLYKMKTMGLNKYLLEKQGKLKQNNNKPWTTEKNVW